MSGERENTRKNSNLEEFSADHTKFSHGIVHTQQHGGERFYKMFCLLFFILFFILVYNNSSLKNHFLEFLLSRAFGLQFFFFLLSLLFFNIIFSHFVQHFLLYWILFFLVSPLAPLRERYALLRELLACSMLCAWILSMYLSLLSCMLHWFSQILHERFVKHFLNVRRLVTNIWGF